MIRPMTQKNFMKLYQDIEEFHSSKNDSFMGVSLDRTEKTILGSLQTLIITNLSDLNRLESQISFFTFSINLRDIFYSPHEDLPLFLNDPDPRVVCLIKWRLTRQES